MNYKLKALSIHVNGRVYLKDEGFIFNEKNTNPVDLKNAFEAGFLETTDQTDETGDGVPESEISTGVTAAIASAYIATLTTIEDIDKYIINENRSSVIKAADKRKNEL